MSMICLCLRNRTEVINVWLGCPVLHSPAHSVCTTAQCSLASAAAVQVQPANLQAKAATHKILRIGNEAKRQHEKCLVHVQTGKALRHR